MVGSIPAVNMINLATSHSSIASSLSPSPFNLLHGPPVTQTFAKLEREIEVTSVAQLGSSFFVTKFQDQVTSATVESPEPRCARNALSELNLIRRLSRGVEQQ